MIIFPRPVQKCFFFQTAVLLSDTAAGRLNPHQTAALNLRKKEQRNGWAA